jgi:glycine cleavage system H lipoate-binding protein
MQCPYIRETRVNSCANSGIRKLIPQAEGMVATGRCAAGDWRECAWCSAEAKQEVSLNCPLRQESLMQYCAAAPVMRFVPYSEPLLSRCGSDAYHYCELFLDVMSASRHAEAELSCAPPDLLYTRNHWWLDASGDGPCHLGIDAFLARLLGHVERVAFATPHGFARPTVILTTGGVDFSATFPELLSVEACNLHLRAEPGRLTAEPYSLGWIFEGTLSGAQRIHLRETLLDPAAATELMQEDARGVNQFIQSREARAGETLAADGGTFAAGLLACLEREESQVLFNHFCPPLAGEGRH